MVKVPRYISHNFVKSFLTIFLPFFLIISLVFLVKIAGLTSKIQLSILELLQLYSYSIPDIIFYTLPLSFITALANVLVRLSQDNELIALYALGLNAQKILHSPIVLGVLFSVLLASISFLAMPLAKQLNKSFIEEKKSEAKLNIIPGELGQKFGEYYIYVKEKNDELYTNMVIYNRESKENEQFFSAQTGRLNNTPDTTSLLLYDGYGYTYSEEKLQQAQYKTLEVYDSIKKKTYEFEDIIAHWSRAATEEKMMHRVLFFVFVSLIPLLSVYLVAAFTMINPRYQANRSFLVISTITFTLYMIASSLEKWGTPYLLFFSILITGFLGIWLFNKRVARYF